MSTQTGDAPVFLATLQPDARQYRVVLGVLAVALVLFTAAAPFARVQLPAVWAFLPVYQTTLIINASITALLLFGQVPILRSWPLLVLACGYLFSGGMAIAHLLSFPGLFAPGGLLAAGPQTSAWLYYIWHDGFAIAVMGYGLLKGRDQPAAAIPNRWHVAIAGGIVAVLLLVLSLVFATTAGKHLLPVIMNGHNEAPLKHVVALFTWLLGLVALVTVWWRRPRTLLDVWLLVVMCAWMFDTTLSAVLNDGRFSLGWYAGRICGLLAESILLMMLLFENGLLYARLSLMHARERRRAGEALRASEARFEATFEQGAVGIALLDPDGRWLRTNRRLRAMTGYDEPELAGLTWQAVTHPDDPPAESDVMRRILESEIDSHVTEKRLLRRNGEPTWMNRALALARRADGTPDYFTVVVEDIQARKEVESALRASEQRFRAVFDKATVSIYVLDGHTGAILDANRRAIAANGCRSLEELQASDIWLEPPYSFADALRHVHTALRLGEQRHEWMRRGPGGHFVWEDVLLARVNLDDSERVLAVATDVTARKALEREVIEAATAEQERIGHEIHDGIGQQLTGLTMLASSVQHRLSRAGHAAEAHSVGQLRKYLQEALDDARSLSKGLAPVEIGPDGLADALSRLTEQVTGTAGIPCRYRGAHDVYVNDGNTAIHLYRIAQEAVQNALRHAAARTIDVDLTLIGERLVLSVRDDGRGIEAESGSGAGLGLHIMAYRAGIIGARLDIRQRRRGGTLVCCEVPPSPAGTSGAAVPDEAQAGD